MAVAYDAQSESHTGTTGATTTFSWTHTPSGTPRSVLVFVFNRAGGSGMPVSSVTYGGVALTAVPGGEAEDTTAGTEGGTVKAYHLGASIPTGAQTVQVNASGALVGGYAVCFTSTAGDDTYVTGVVTEANNQTLAEENVADDSNGVNSLRYAGILSGASAVPSAGANSTAGPGIDYGAYVNGTYRETTAGQGSRPVGASFGTSDDVAAVYLAVCEGEPPPPPATGGTVLTASSSTANATSRVTASISPTADRLLILDVTSMGFDTTDRKPPDSVSGLSLTWTKIDDIDAGASPEYTNVSSWKAYTGSSPGSGAVTMSFGSNTQDTTIWCITEYPCDTALGASSVETPSKASDNNTAPSPGTIAFAGSGSFTHCVIGFGDPNNATTTTCTHDADWNEIDERTGVDSAWWIGQSVQSVGSQVTANTSTLGTAEKWGAIAFGIKQASAGTPVTLTTSLAAAVQAARTATASMQAAVQAPQSATTGLATAVQQAFSAAASIDTVAQAAQAATAGLQLALQAAQAASTSADAAVQAEHSSTASADAAVAVPATATAGVQVGVQAGATSTTVLEAAVQAARTAVASIDVAAQVAQTHTTALEALVQAERTATFGIDAQVQGATSLTAQMQAAVQDGAQAQTSADAAVQLAQSATSAIAAAVQASRTAAADLQAAVQAARTATFGIDAQVQGGSQLAALVDAAVQQALQAGVGVDAALQAERTAALGLSAQVQAGGVIAIGLEVAVLAAASATAGVQIAVQEARAASLGIAAAVSVQRVLTAAMAAATQVPVAVTCACSAYVESDAPPLPDWPAGGTARIGERAPVDTLDRVGQAAPGTRTTRIGSSALPRATKRIG